MLKKGFTGSELHELQDPSPELTRVDEGPAEFKGDDQNPALPIFCLGSQEVGVERSFGNPPCSSKILWR